MGPMPTNSQAPDHADEIVCYCHRVSRGAIVLSFRAGARTLRDDHAATGAGHGNRCQELNPKGTCCSADIRRILAEEVPAADA